MHNFIKTTLINEGMQELYETDYYLISDLIKLCDIKKEVKISFIKTIGDLFINVQNGSTCLKLKEKHHLDFIYDVEKGVYDVILQNNDISYTPLVIRTIKNEQYLYFYRYYMSETLLEKLLINRFSLKTEEILLDDSPFIKSLIEEIFNKNEIDIEKKRAVYLSLTSKTMVISGGPGTGKTFTAKLITDYFTRAFVEKHKKTPEILLTAPTGKAAKRLEEQFGDLPTTIKSGTLHRALGYNPKYGTFKYKPLNTYGADLIIVDEISMIDVHLFKSFLEAIDDSTTLILIGDQNQLPSVDSGSVLQDILPDDFTPAYKNIPHEISDTNLTISDTNNENSNGKFSYLTNNVIKLHTQKRSVKQITDIASKIQKGDCDVVNELEKWNVKDLLEKGLKADEGIHFVPITSNELIEFTNGYSNWIQNILNNQNYSAANLNDLYDAIHSKRILTIVREGLYGANGINKIVHSNISNFMVTGEPLMITSNDYDLELYNGDMGIIYIENNKARCFIPSKGIKKTYAIRDLKNYSYAYALTTHKSQGSEFDDVFLILPDNNNPLLTREVLYTAITRAKKRAWVLGSADIFKQAIKNRSERTTGLSSIFD